MNKQEKKRRAEEETRRTMDLLDRQSRQEADPWLAERTIARLQGPAEPAYHTSGAFQWALTVLLLVLNSAALYSGLNNASATDSVDLGQLLNEEYDLNASAGDPYEFTSNIDDDELYQSN